MRVSTLRGAWGLLPFVIGGAVRAQDVPKSLKPPAFKQLFPQSTGQNGYEDWVQASDLVRNNALVAAAAAPDATLTQKRRLLADPNVARALHLLREGLNKPALSPHALLDKNATYPELSSFLKLAYLLAIEQYVRFASGNADGAIDNFYDSLRFGAHIQSNTINTGLYGIVIVRLGLDELATHLDQLSEYQCSRIRRLVEEWLEWRSPAAMVINSTKQFALYRLEKKRKDPQAFVKDIASDLSANEEGPTGPDAEPLMRYLNGQSNVVGAVIDRAEFLINSYFEAALANLILPIKARRPLLMPKEDTPGGHLFTLFYAVRLDRITDYYDRIETQMRLLGVGAAIRSYRWEHNRLPDSLSDLHLGKLAVDPFTGDMLLYARMGTQYELRSHSAVDL